MKDAYAHANRALGDIVKVTPSSKVPALPILPIPGAVRHNFAYPRDKQGERKTCGQPLYKSSTSG